VTNSAPGNIILLNGCGSSGKSSIAKAIQRTFDAPYLLMGIDIFWSHVFPWEWAGAATNAWQEIPIQDSSPPQVRLAMPPFATFFISGLHHTIAALARIGHNVVVDHALYEASFVTEILTLWQPFPVWLVNVTCPFETLRERAVTRADRNWSNYLPIITWHFEEVHKHTRGMYDLEVDTSGSTPTECALQIKQRVDEQGSPSAFDRLAAP
jgi:chloramphenicol 3-O phosphotransferase